jgi:Phage integrase family
VTASAPPVRIAARGGVGRMPTEVLPDHKAGEIRRLQVEGRAVSMAGDGIPWTVAVGRAGLPPARFHYLRHGTATMLLPSGEPIKVISDILGHATSASPPTSTPRWPWPMPQRSLRISHGRTERKRE